MPSASCYLGAIIPGCSKTETENNELEYAIIRTLMKSGSILNKVTPFRQLLPGKLQLPSNRFFL